MNWPVLGAEQAAAPRAHSSCSVVADAIDRRGDYRLRSHRADAQWLAQGSGRNHATAEGRPRWITTPARGMATCENARQTDGICSIRSAPMGRRPPLLDVRVRPASVDSPTAPLGPLRSGRYSVAWIRKVFRIHDQASVAGAIFLSVSREFRSGITDGPRRELRASLRCVIATSGDCRRTHDVRHSSGAGV